MKYYAVRKGRTAGIYTSWNECLKQVHGFPCAEYKSFTELSQAEAFMQIDQGSETDDKVIAYVDGSFDKVSHSFSYGMVVINGDKEEYFKQKYNDKELAAMRNVAGEIMGARAAMQYALDHDIESITIYHDYEGIAKWCLGLWKAGKEGTIAYRDFYKEASKKVKISFKKVTGHSGDKYNDMADKLAKEALGLG